MRLNRLAATGFFLTMVAGMLPSASANNVVIGMISGQAGVTMDNSRVSGNATVFEGSTISSEGFVRIQLRNGTRLDLSADSQVQIFAKKTSLRTGTTEIQGGSAYEIDADSLRIQPDDTNSIARVRVDGDRRILVTALNSPVAVRSNTGVLVARVFPSLPMAFMLQAGGPNEFDNTGCLLQKGKAAVLVDPSGSQVFEVRGMNFRKAIGNKIHVVGTVDSKAVPVEGAQQVINVTSAKLSMKGGCEDVAKKIGGGAAVVAGAGGIALGAAAASGAAVAGVAAGTTVLVVAGVAAAAAAGVGGAVAASGSKSSSP